jgi:predicted nucleic acid-binding protein
MKVIVDTNIVFSAILNSDGKIGDLLLNSSKIIDFYSAEYLRFEIKNHYDKLTKISNQPIEKIQSTEYYVTKEIKFISEQQISEPNWKAAYKLVKDVDLDDIAFVALSRQLRCKLWTGDKRLIKGLKDSRFPNIITTDELIEYRDKREKNSR